MTRPGYKVVVAAPLLFAIACTSDFGVVRPSPHIVVTFDAATDLGKDSARLPIPLGAPTEFDIRIEAHKANGDLDESFDGQVDVSAEPGTALVLGSHANGRNVTLKAGVADKIRVGLIGAFGDARIWVSDLGATVIPANSDPPPACSDGIDNNHNGLIDFPADPGCASPVDDSENGGSYAAGVSPSIHFAFPRIADVRGRNVVANATDQSSAACPPPGDARNLDPMTGCIEQGGTGTNFPKDALLVDTGYRPNAKKTFAFSVIVTRISPDGFYVTDLGDDKQAFPNGVDPVAQNLRDHRQDYGSLFAFNFSAPPNLAVCDRLTGFAGTASDFFGFTEINYPTWSVIPWDGKSDCPVPEAFLFDDPKHPFAANAPDFPNGLATLPDKPTLFAHEASLVRVATDGPYEVHVSKHFGPEIPKTMPDPANPTHKIFVPADNASNCDINGDGKVDFVNDPEKSCAAACAGENGECSEYSDFAARSNYQLIVTDSTPGTAYPSGSIGANTQQVAGFDPIQNRGKSLRSFTGTLRFFSGGNQWTMEARCPGDVVTDLKANVFFTHQVCIPPRTTADTEGQL